MSLSMKEAIYTRHTVRQYKKKAIPQAILDKLSKRIEQVNQTYNTKISLKCDQKDGLFLPLRYVIAKNAINYMILASDDRIRADENIGEASADLMLYAQTLGLNTWWIGGTWNHKKVKTQAQADHVIGILVFGYGETSGKPHPSKNSREVSLYEGKEPDWFRKGVDAALLAPTALNKQNFFLQGKGDEVSIHTKEAAFSLADQGIVRYFFELGAGKDNFKWIY
ncbi:nitroreductase family protein [Dubosiella newyorkensis]|uniref:nitroreductase family protein n=1 Tax=Dubosiella newyorkensis TaxID=1862672 RepID=UPI00272D964E|nr:nitroreductase family protein [Dubosiella newyorkensis]